ncbi:MAG: hypothetical protein HYX63_21425, partial [Gammaproteobacteria bacterium]|nr:hypothetical protein [Gammaproteobacteria bacterium]
GFGTLSNCCVGGTPSLTNNGLIEATVAGQTLLINPSAFTNNGTLRASSGTLSIAPTNVFTNTGVLDLGTTGTISTSNQNLINGTTGTLIGSGTFNLGTGTFFNQGLWSPGNSPGLVRIIGNLNLTGGTLNMELQGLTRGVLYDAIEVSGDIILGGVLTVSASRFTPVLGDLFRLIGGGSAGTLSGAFASANLPPDPNYTLDAALSGNNVMLFFGPAVAVNSWNTDLSGLWQSGTNWSLGHAPSASEVALIDRGAADPLVTISSSSQALRFNSFEDLQFSNAGATFSVSGNSTAYGNFNWTAGTITGGGLISVNGILSVDPAPLAHFDVRLDGGTTLRNTNFSGGSHWNGRADWRIVNGSTFENTGRFEFQALDPSVGRSIIGSGATSIVRNTATGTFLKTGPTWTNIGFGSDIRFENAGAINVTTNTFTINSDSLWNGASGAVAIANGATLQIGGGTNDLGATPISGLGTVLVEQNSGFSQALSTTTFSGLFTPAALTVNSGNTVVNGTPAVGSVNLGTLIVGGGTLSFNNTQPVTLGALMLSGGTVNANGALRSGRLDLLRGFLGGTGSFTLTPSGAALLGDGSLTVATFNVAPNATVDLNNSGDTRNGPLLFEPATFNNDGIVNWIGRDLTTATRLTTFNNRNGAQLNILNTQAWNAPCCGGGDYVFNNQAGATVTKSSPGFSTLKNINNAGTLLIRDGVFNIGDAARFDSVSNTGVIEIAATGTFRKLFGFANTLGGTLRGAGTIEVETGFNSPFVNNGTIAPGTAGIPIATLTFQGPFVQGPTGTLEIEQDTAGNRIDRLALGGTGSNFVRLDGNLIVRSLNAPPANGSAFNFITAPGLAFTNDFATKTLPPNFTASPNGVNYTLNFSVSRGCIGGTLCFDNNFGDFLWTNLLNWNLNRLPTVADDVVIDLPGAPTVRLDAGTHSIRTLNLALTDLLDITGGSLAIGKVSTLAGALRVNGGTLTSTEGLNLAALNLNAGAATFNADTVVRTLTLASGTLGLGTATLTLTAGGASNWSGGQILGSAVAGSKLALAAGATFNVVNGANVHDLNLLTVNNQGAWNIRADRNALRFDNGTIFNNLAGGVFDFQTDGGVGASGGGVFNNSGTLSKTLGTGVSSFGPGGILVNNRDGTLSAATGVLDLNTNGTHTGVTTLVGNGVTFSAGTQTFSTASFAGGGALKVNGATVTFDNVTYNKSIELTGGSVSLLNDASIPAGADVTINHRLGGPGALLNAGTLNLSKATIDGSLLNAGALNILNGASVVNGPTTRIDAGAVTVAAGATLTKNTGSFDWNGGALGGKGTVDLLTGGAVFNITGSGARVIDGLDLVLNSLTVPAGSLELRSGSLNVSGITTIPLGTSFIYSGGNLGLSGPVNNAGLVDLRTGTVNLDRGGAHTGRFNLAPAATLNFGGGSHDFGECQIAGGGTAVFSGGAITLSGAGRGLALGTGTRLDLAGSDIGGPGQLETDVGSTLTWTRGNIDGSGTIEASGVTNLAGVGTLALNRPFNNRGTVNWLSGPFNLISTFSNGGTFNTLINASNDEISGSGRFDNAAGASFNHTPGAAESFIRTAFANSGTLTVFKTLHLDQDFNNAGVLNLAANGKLTAGSGSGAPRVFENGDRGRVMGVGAIDVASFASVPFTNAGVTAPGNSPGTLTILGNFLQTPAGVLEVELGGLVPGVSYDLLRVTGTATLGGTLALKLFGDFRPRPSDSFDVVAYARQIGDFSTLVLPSGRSFAVAALSSVYQISVAADLVLSPQPANNVLVMPGFTLADPIRATILTGSLGEPLIEFTPRRSLRCN